MIIDDKVKLISKYEVQLVHALFSQKMVSSSLFVIFEVALLVQEESGPSQANLFAGRYIIDPNQALTKEVEPVAQLQKILKFRL
ncbi:hypothetical protein NC651_003951 [Populus alba x Populus x berolinensis]|nr:hypothetical protein NC651_003951 [Populus alba x Populus x berolinensis]